jgi:tetratricopeptide (TPR) repeat protein
MYRLKFNLTLLLFLFAGCSSERYVMPDTFERSADAQPTLNIIASRSMYLFSLARLHALEGDYDAALTLLQASIEADPQSAFLHVSVADLYLKLNRVQEAINSCRTAISLDPKLGEAQLLLANMLAGLKQERAAIEHYKNGIELLPEKEEAYLQLAIVYLRIFDYEEAVKTLKTLIEKSPDSPLAYYYLGKSYEQMKLPNESLGYYRRVIEMKPDFEPVYLDIGLSLEAQGDRTQAIQTYESLLRVNPHNFSVMQHLVQVYIQEKRLDDALKMLNILVSRGVGGLDTRRKAGLVYLELEQYDNAIREFEFILAQEPKASQVRFYLASAYEDKGETDHAIEEFRKIPPNAFNYADALGHIAYIYQEAGEGEKGIALLTDAIAADRSRLDLYLHLAGVYEGQKRYREALDTLLAVETSFPDEAKIHFRIGILHDKLGERDKLIERMKKALAQAPDDPQALNYLGYTYVEMGTNLDEALLLLKKAVSLRPNDGFILDSLGWAYFKLKRYRDAVSELERASEIVDDDPTIKEHLADAYLATRDYAKAIKLYRQVLQLEPERKDIAEKIKKAKAESGEK